MTSQHEMEFRREEARAMEEMPSAYTIAVQGGRFYPLRFGRFRLDARGYRISFGRREDAVAFCHNEQASYVTGYPAMVRHD